MKYQELQAIMGVSLRDQAMLAATIDYLEPAEPFRNSRFERRPIGHPSTIRDLRSAPHDVVVQDLSAGGCSFVTDAGFPVGSLIRVGLAGAGATQARVVWRRDGRYGCAFVQPLAPLQLADAFGATEPVAPFPSASDLPGDASDTIEPDHAMWPGSVRVLIHVGLGSAAWAGVILVLRLVA